MSELAGLRAENARLRQELAEARAALSRRQRRRAEELPDGEPSGWIYYVMRDGVDDYIKIGKAQGGREGLARRGRRLERGGVRVPPGTPCGGAMTMLACEPGEQPVEAQRHAQFATLQVPGTREWFRYTGPLAEHVRALAAQANSSAWAASTNRLAWRSRCQGDTRTAALG